MVTPSAATTNHEGEPREPARQVATPDGHLVRYDEDGEVIGITIVNAKWLSERDSQIEIPLRLHADLALAFS
jgi:uncharacterized protein YuzE